MRYKDRFSLSLISALMTLGVSFSFSHSSLEEKEGIVSISSRQEEVRWVKKLVEKYPELAWLAAMPEKREKEEGATSLSFSKEIYNKGSPEFDRAVMSIHCLEIFLQGKYEDYLEFVSKQPKALQLQWQSFLDIQTQMRSVLKNYQKLSQDSLENLFKVAIVLNDVIKSELAAHKIQNFLGNQCFREELLCRLEEFGKALFPSYNKLSSLETKLLGELVGLVNFGEIARLENGPEMFTKLKKSQILVSDPLVFEMSLFLYSCSIAGTLAHVDQRSSLVYNEDVHRNLIAIKNACYLLKDHNEIAAYDDYLSVRADWLGLDIGSPLHRTLTRVGTMLTLYSKDEGRILKECFLKLEPENLALVVEEFNIHRKDYVSHLPTSLPSLLINLSSGLLNGNSQKECLEQTVKILAKMLKCQKMATFQGRIGGSKPLNFGQVAKVAKNDPMSLVEADFLVDDLGNVILK